jgi:zinc protease
MLIKKTTFAALLLILLAACVSSDGTPHVSLAITPARQGERVLHWPWQESDLQPDAAIHFGTLSNGMRYAIRANHNPSSTASVRMRFDTGSLMEDDDQRGLAHFMEHMAFNGSTNVPEGEMVHILQRQGLSFGAHTNAYTSFDETVYQLDAPNVEPATLNTVFMLLREVASNLTIDPDAVERERGVILSEERSRNAPDFRAQLAEWHGLYPNARFSNRIPIGLVDVIQHARAARLRDYYESYYRPERAFFVISGDVDVDAMEAKIRETFSDWRATRPDPGDPNLGAASGGAQAGYFYDPGLATSVELSVAHSALREPNTSETVRQDLLRAVANNIVSRRLLRLARATGSHFQAAQVADQDVYDTLHLSSVSLSTRPEEWRAALASGEQEIRRAVEYGFTQAEVDEQVSRLRNAFQVSAQGAATRTTPQLADEIVGQFGQWGVDTTPAFDLSLFERLASSITPDAVARAFRAQWQGAELQVFVNSSAPIENAPAQELAALNESRQVAVTAPANEGALHFAYTNFGTPGEIAERNDIADLGITTVRFANNVRLNLKHTDFSRDAVSVSVRFGGGLLELPLTEPGLTLLVGSIPEGGLEAHSADDVQSILAGHNIHTAIESDADAFQISGATNPRDLELQLQLMAAYLTHPGYRTEALDRFRQNISNQYRTISASPGGVAQRDVGRLLRSGDPRYGIPPLSDLTARSFDELRTALARASGHGAIEIGIVGDIDIDRTITLVGSTFGALPPRDSIDSPFTDARRIAFPIGDRGAHVLHHQGQANRAMALTYWPTTDDSNPRQQRTLQLLRAVLTLKLIERVRETEGATYSPSAQAFFAHANPGYGYLGVSLDLVPENVNRFFGIVDQIAASLKAGDISADELERARRPILDEFRNNQEDNDYWMALVATAQSNPAGLQRHRETIADYSAVTIADLRASARRYLVADRAYRIAILPGSAP